VDLREYHLRQRNITIDAQYAFEPLMAMVNRDEIQQLFLNLLLNAEHAMTASGVPGTIRVTTGSEKGRHFVEIADSGPGISPELRGRIFEPFFTTKQVGEGTGLGLSISHGIAYAHGGTLDLMESEGGARFRLSLPAVSDGRDVAVPSTAAASPSGHAALVVDDEVPIRELLARLLERRGYTVNAADTGAAALRLAASSHFSLVICDIRMPGVSGIELHRRFQQDHPGSARHFVFMTGDTHSVEAMPIDNGTAVLAKPFTAADLDALLARIGLPRGAD
jgi:CheY-like chemotaxis protein